MNSLEKQQSLLKTYLETARASLARKPDGHLTISRSHNSDQFYHRTSIFEKKGVYLSKKNKTLISALAQKDYDQKFITAAEDLFRKNNTLIQMGAEREIHYFYQDLAQVYTDLSAPRKKLVTPYVPPDDIFAASWASVRYKGKKFSENYPYFYTEKKERVRSKSEILIADKLLGMNLPYRYEFPLYTKLLGTTHPDFTILDVWNRTVKIFEHFGRLDGEDYRNKMVRKFEAYRQEGFYLGVNFLFTMETNNQPLDITYFVDLIKINFPYANQKNSENPWKD